MYRARGPGCISEECRSILFSIYLHSSLLHPVLIKHSNVTFAAYSPTRYSVAGIFCKEKNDPLSKVGGPFPAPLRYIFI